MSRSYMPQMDGLRAIAVSGVLVQHWFDLQRIPTGGYGVILFFVISGYLITGSIFALKDRGTSIGQGTREFFGRRTRRLFPAYYLMLACAFLIVPALREHWLWYVTYTSNILQQAVGNHYSWLTPTWSLAVEEQFYLAWFVVLFLVPERRMLFALLVPAGLAIGLRGYIVGGGDALAAGALLCLMERRAVGPLRWSSWSAVPLVAAATALAWSGGAWAVHIWPSFIALAGAVLVWRSRGNYSSLWDRFLALAPIVYIGRISYGIYLYHMLVPPLYRMTPGIWRLGFVGDVAITIGLAALSYHLFERRFMNRRREAPAYA